MSEADRIINGANAPYHSVSHYESPDEVLCDETLSALEKRIILSSWASDIYAVEANPALRAIPGLLQPMRLHDILAALRQLDGEHDPRPRGGAAMRLTRPIAREAVARAPAVVPGRPSRVTSASSTGAAGSNGRRWTREANIRRYRWLLRTELSDRERQFVERRLAEELQGTVRQGR